MEGETNRDDSCHEGFDSNRHVDRLVSPGNRLGSVDQINRCWDHDYDWLLLDDDLPPEPSTAISPVPVHYTKSSWGSSPESNALQGPPPIHQHLAALLLPGERGYRTSDVTANTRIASELDPLNYFQIDWSYTPRNDHVAWIPFPRIGQTLEESSGEEDRLIHEIVGALLRYEFGDHEDFNVDTRLDLGILGEPAYLPWNWGSNGLSEEMIRASLKERKHGASESVEQCCICQEDYVDGDDLGILDCKHEFHMSCIEKWLLLKNRCPICNRKAMENGNSSSYNNPENVN